MSYLKSRSLVTVVAIAFTSPLFAGDDPIHERHELMEGVGDAAKPIGQMLKGEREFDAGVVMTSFETFDKASAQFGGLFPPVAKQARVRRQRRRSGRTALASRKLSRRGPMP